MVKWVREGEVQEPTEQWSAVADQFEALVNDGTMQWREIRLVDLPSQWAQSIVRQFLVPRLRWWLGSITIEGAICVKIDDPFLQYADIFPNRTWLWCSDDHHTGVHPDRALEYLLLQEGLPTAVVNVEPGHQRIITQVSAGEVVTDWFAPDVGQDSW